MLLLAGCPSPANTTCSGPVGEAGQPVALGVVLRGADGTTTVAADGAAAALIQPPQGGKVILAGVRARNLDTCGVNLIAAVRDLCTNRVQLEGRPVNLIVADDGWAYPAAPAELDNFANIGVCPNVSGVRNLYGEPYRVEVSVTDKNGKQGSASVMVVPFCAEPEHALDCACTCAARYVLGSSCAARPDAGPGGCPPGDAGVRD
ncbi:MAG TPA: hypothetical protein VKE22_11560 [Haliangiales bacterium]|nr:hypothetical protein [Haliangiales bacterium]